MPITVGGGDPNGVEDVRTLLNHGADKVSVDAAAIEDPGVMERIADAFGRQCLVASIDYRADDSGTPPSTGRHGADRSTAGRLGGRVLRAGCGRAAAHLDQRDGGGAGLDIDATRSVVDAVDVPVITGGGCGVAAHFVEGFKSGGADAVAAGTYFALRDQNPIQARSHIANAGIPIRLHT